MMREISKIHHSMLIRRGCYWASMKIGAVNLETAKPGAVLCPKRGAVASQLVPKLKESVTPPPPPRSEQV